MFYGEGAKNSGLMGRVDLNLAHGSIEWDHIWHLLWFSPLLGIVGEQSEDIFFKQFYMLLEKTQDTVAQLSVIMQASYDRGSNELWK